jgi:GNAT superfamily N-acetyltransferase
MIKVSQVNEVNELIKYWPRLFSLVRKETPTVNSEGFLQLLLTCLTNGAIFVVKNDGGLCGVCCVEDQSNGSLTLQTIPNDRGTGVARACLDAVKTWGVHNGFNSIEVSTERMSGSSFRYFEKSLGFHRSLITFTLPLEPLNPPNY